MAQPQQRRHNSKKRRRGRHPGLYKALSAVLILAAVAAACVIFFRVSQVEVRGNRRYTAQGTAVFVENMFASRYRHIDELTRMGAHIRTEGRVAVVTGVDRLHAGQVEAFDLRGGAALAVAALGAEGESAISGLRHIRRGYEALDRDLTALGARAVILEKK